MSERIITVKELSEEVDFNSTIEFATTNVGYFTHGYFKYPCKFIPQVPRWAILKYTKPGQLVLDPFAGSGTSLVESVLQERNGLGVDFDKLSQLLCKTKTQKLNLKQIRYLKEIDNILFKPTKDNGFQPDLHNIKHWFPKENIKALSNLKASIEQVYGDTKDKKIYNFLLVCFASVIKKCSYADDASPKPYVSTRIKKEPSDVKREFLKAKESYIKSITDYMQYNLGKVNVISEDARNLNIDKYKGKVALAVTSPPYINAFDYVRSLRLENAWLDFYGDSNIVDVKRRQIGTETVGLKEYQKGFKDTGFKILDSILHKIAKADKKRAYVVYKFFMDMASNFAEVKKLLKPKGHYVVVVGDSMIRGVEVPTHDIFIDIAKKNGFQLENMFSYLIKNRYLRIPRSGRGGLIKKDWVLDLVKANG
ncbi:DNA methyltransferase [Candidatus Omnitrophota bacterium]